MAETGKAHERRLREGFYDKFCQGFGIDLGVGRLDTWEGEDALPIPNICRWDRDNGDATFMSEVDASTFDFVYASHILEHISNPYIAIKNWWRILKPRGHLILFVPDRDLYEKRISLPSRWNADHKFFILPEHDELPFTLGLRPLIEGALGGEKFDIIYLVRCQEGYDVSEPDRHSGGEYSIEAVIKKNPQATPDLSSL